MNRYQKIQFSSLQSTSLQHLEFEDGTVPMVKKTGGSGRMSPVRARTMKEYEQQIAELQKENFSLKLRIYFLEERMKKEFDGAGEDIYKINIELQVEVESLKQDLIKKQDLLKQASNALESISGQHQVELQQACQYKTEEIRSLMKSDVAAAELTVNDLRTQLRDADELVQKLRADVAEANQKLLELLSVNEMLDSHCRILESEKHKLELQFEAAVDSSSDSEHEVCKIRSAEVVLLEKEKLIEHLRCGLRAKDVIIEQLEEEKKELALETAQQFEDRIAELTAKLNAFESGTNTKDMANQNFYEVDELGRTADSGASEPSSHLNSTFEEMEKQCLNIVKLEQQLMEVKNSLCETLKDNEILKKNSIDAEHESDGFKRKIGELESDINRLKLDAEAASRAIAEKETSLKELKTMIENERQLNAATNTECKALRDTAERQMAVHEHTVEQLLNIIKQRDVNIHQYLTVNQDPFRLPTLIADSDSANPVPISKAVGGQHDANAFHTVLATLQDTMSQMAAKDVEIKVLHDNHSKNVQQLNEEIIALRLRLDQTVGMTRVQRDVETEHRGGVGRDFTVVIDSISSRSTITNPDDLSPTYNSAEDLIQLSECIGYDASKTSDAGVNDNVHMSLGGASTNRRDTGVFSHSNGSSNLSSTESAELRSPSTSGGDAVGECRTAGDEINTTKFSKKEFQTQLRENNGQQIVEFCESRVNDEVSSSGCVGTPNARLGSNSDLYLNGSGEQTHARQQSALLALQAILQDVRKAITVDDVREACNKMDRIFTSLNQMKNDASNGVSNKAFSQSDAGQSVNDHFNGLTSESFSTDRSEASRIEDLGVSQKASSIGWDTTQDVENVLESSWLTGTSLLNPQSLCDSTLPNHIISISQDEFMALKLKLAEQEQSLTVLSAKLEKTQSAFTLSNEKSVDSSTEPDSMQHEKRTENVLAQQQSTTLAIALPNSSSAISSNADALVSLQLELNSTRDSELRLQNELVKLSQDVDEMSTRLRHADNTISLLKRHIELNSAPDGASSPGLNPDLIVALAIEVERLNCELEKYQTEPPEAGGNQEEYQQAIDTQGRRAKTETKKRSGIPVRTSHIQRNVSHNINEIQLNDADGAYVDEPCTRSSCTGISSLPSKSICVNSDCRSDCRAEVPLHAGLGIHDRSLEDENLELTGPSLDAVSQRKSVGVELQNVSILPSRDVSRVEYYLDSSKLSHTPFNTISVANKRAFSELQSEVERLRKRLELSELENSRLMDMSRRETLALSFLSSADSKTEVKRGEATDGLHCVEALSAEPGQVVLSTGFLKNLMEAHRHDHTGLQRRLADSHETCRLLRSRMVELVGFLQEMLLVTPPQKSAAEKRAHVSACLDETRSFLADLSVNLDGHDNTFIEGLSLQELDFSSIVDLNGSIAKLKPQFDSSVEVRESDSLVEHPNQASGHVSRMQLEVLQLVKLRDDMQTALDDVKHKLAFTENELSQACLRNSEITAELQSLKKIYSEQESELVSTTQRLQLTESALGNAEAKLTEAAERFLKMKARNEELLRIQLEMQNVLIEQEKNVTECEEQVRQVTKERVDERNALRKTLTDHVSTITLLKREREEQLVKIAALESEVEQLNIQMKGNKSKSLKGKDGVDERDTMISRLKALVRDNKTTAERLREELQRMNEETDDKNKIISRLRHSCKDLSARCIELETALCRSTVDAGEHVSRENSFGDLSDFSHLRKSFSDFSDQTIEDRSILVSVPDDSSVEQVRYTAEDEVLQQQAIDFSTWIQQNSIETHTRNASGDEACSVPGLNANEDECERSKSLSDLGKASSNKTFRGQLSPQRELLNTLKLQFMTCEDISKVIRAVMGACGSIRHTSSNTVGNGEGDSKPNDKFTGDQNVEKLLNQLQDSLIENDKIRQRLKSNFSCVAGNVPVPKRSVSEWIANQAASVQTHDAEIDHELLKSHNASLLQVLSLSQNQLASSELELTSMHQRLEEATSLNRALRLELEISSRLLTEDDKENRQASRDTASKSFDLEGVLSEIRNLRTQLERSVASNNMLHQKLDKYVENRQADLPSVGVVHRAEEGQHENAIGCLEIAIDRLQLAVVTQTSLEYLRGETDKISNLLGQLETVCSSMVSNSEDPASGEFRNLIAQAWRAHREQHRLITTFYNIPANDDRSSAAAAVIDAENMSLKHQLAELKSKYLRLKQAMKAAQERLDADSRKKENLLILQRGWKNDEAIIEQINKTRQVLAQSSRNLLRHHKTSVSGKPKDG